MTMPKPYSRDLRERVVGAVEAGASCREAAATFEVGGSSASCARATAPRQVPHGHWKMTTFVAALRTYQDLEEPAVAREGIGRILDGVKQAGLPDAIRKARLLPHPAAVTAPELYLASFLDVI